jgi:hypothetical protein
MKRTLMAMALPLLLVCCSVLPVASPDSPPSWQSGDPIPKSADKVIPPLTPQEKAAFHKTERANALFTDDMTLYADKIEFVDSIHSECIATGHVWLKCAHEIGTMQLQELLADKAEVNLFAKSIRLQGRPRALTKTNEFTATKDSTYFELSHSEDGGIQFKIFGPNRVDPVAAE